ncbi:MAG: pilus assembly protein [Anaerolineae bacterium CG17_big_fil_post_rev_8_21_14_2_50_57_27]|nr:MAG: pilus assembly protein [Anaerolineae bacterium CG17_big_fil_post_rev_8_21_14_2_50_57_27]PJH75874.1 MAG: pilus assembly protein [Anaerolineae bacterium CG_4_9_14_0_8_um_filter_58_9]
MRSSDRKEVSRLLSYAGERGQGLVKYALILLLVVLVVIAVVTLLGPIVGNMFSKVNSKIPQ